MAKVMFDSVSGGRLTIDGHAIENAHIFTFHIKAGDLPVAIVEAFTDDTTKIEGDVERLAWIVRRVGHLPTDAHLEVIAEAATPDTWTVRLVKPKAAP